MKKILYFIFPSVAFVLILVNMIFGHLIFDSPYGQDINKYSIYVHLQPEWKSHPGNIFYDITNVWSNPDPKSTVGVFYDLSEPGEFFDYNSNQLQFQNSKSFVRLNHEFSNCESSWKPPLYRYAVDSVRNNIEFMQGTQLRNDPYVSEFPNIVNEKYVIDSDIREESFVQFIPICTSKESTTYEFAVSINDKNLAFDAFFVPSEKELEKYLSENSFDYYEKEGCYTKYHQSFSGTCSNISRDSGLLVVLPDNLNLSMTKLKISLHEIG